MNNKEKKKNLEGESVEEPRIYSVSKDLKQRKFSRREFIEVVTLASTAVAITACGESETNQTSPGNGQPGAANSDPEIASTATPDPTKTSTAKPTATKTSVPSETPVPEVRVIEDSVNFRSGPATNYYVLRVLALGERLILMGRLSDNSWFFGKTTDGEEGWIKATLIDLSGYPVNDLPIKTPPPTPIPPEPTDVPGKQGNVEPGETGIEYTSIDSSGRTITYTLPCGSPIPAGAVCTCNCVTVPAAGCSCDGYVSCTCDAVTSHYWYPN